MFEEDQTSAPVTLMEFRAYRSGPLRGFLKVRIGDLVLNDLTLMIGSKGPWVTLPSKPQVDRDGQPIRDAQGKQRYNRLVEFMDRESGDRFQREVISQIQQKHPNAVD